MGSVKLERGCPLRRAEGRYAQWPFINRRKRQILRGEGWVHAEILDERVSDSSERDGRSSPERASKSAGAVCLSEFEFGLCA